MPVFKPEPELLIFVPPLPLCALDEEGRAIPDAPVVSLSSGDRVAIKHPWREARYLPCVVRGREGEFWLEVGYSLGKLVQYSPEEGWCCLGLTHQSDVAKGLLEAT